MKRLILILVCCLMGCSQPINKELQERIIKLEVRIENIEREIK